MLYRIEHATGLVIYLHRQAMFYIIGQEQLWMIRKAGFYDIMVYVAAITLLWSMSVYLTVLGLVATLSFGVESFVARCGKRRARARAMIGQLRRTEEGTGVD
jgi:hypothetical protein